MKHKRARISPFIFHKRSLLFFLEVGALSFYLWNRWVYDWIAEKGNAPPLLGLTYLGIALLVGGILSLILVLYTRFMALHTQQEPKAVVRLALISLMPLLLLFLSLIEHFVYLRNIRGVLLLTSLLGTAYLQYCLVGQLLKDSSPEARSAQKKMAIRQRVLRPKEASHLVLVFSICLYLLYASGLIFPAHPITGDEPHYLLLTHSLLYDGDVNLFDNYRDKDYLRFYPGELEPHANPGKRGAGFEYSKHTPALSLLLAPFYFMGEKLGGTISSITHNPIYQKQTLIFTLRVSMGILAALLSWVFFLFARDLTKNQKAALCAWFIFTLTSPLIFYSHLIYPEIPASLILIVILYRVLSSRNLASSAHLWIGLGIALLPWLGVKYIILSVGLFVIVVITFCRSGQMRGKNIFLFIAPLCISSGFFLYYLWSLYGNIWPSSLYKGYLPSGASLSLAIFHFKMSEFFRCGLSYLFDQRIGIFPYSPIYLVLIPGIVLFFAHKKRTALPLFGMFLLYGIFCSLAYYWGGYCPPGRTLLPVTFILALFMAGALAWGEKKYSIPTQRILLFLSLGIAFICARDPKLLYHESLSDFNPLGGPYSNLLTSLSNSFVNLRVVAPALTVIDQIVWTPIIFWVLAIAFICFVFLRKENEPSSVHGDFRKSVFAVYLFSALFLVYTFFDIHLERVYVFPEQPYALYFQDANNFGPELGGFWTLGQMTSEILIKTDTRASEIRVKLSSPAPGSASARVGRAKQSASRSGIEAHEQTLSFPSPVGFPWKGGYLYSICVKEERGFHPFRLDPKVQDNRFLGVFVEIAVEMDEKTKSAAASIKIRNSYFVIYSLVAMAYCYLIRAGGRPPGPHGPPGWQDKSPK